MLADGRPLRGPAPITDDRRLRAGPRLHAARPDPRRTRAARTCRFRRWPRCSWHLQAAAASVTGERDEALKRRLRTGTVVNLRRPQLGAPASRRSGAASTCRARSRSTWRAARSRPRDIGCGCPTARCSASRTSSCTARSSCPGLGQRLLRARGRRAPADRPRGARRPATRPGGPASAEAARLRRAAVPVEPVRTHSVRSNRRRHAITPIRPTGPESPRTDRRRRAMDPTRPSGIAPGPRRLAGRCLCGQVEYEVADAFAYAMFCLARCAGARRARPSRRWLACADRSQADARRGGDLDLRRTALAQRQLPDLRVAASMRSCVMAPMCTSPWARSSTSRRSPDDAYLVGSKGPWYRSRRSPAVRGLPAVASGDDRSARALCLAPLRAASPPRAAGLARLEGVEEGLGSPGTRRSRSNRRSGRA